MVGKLIPTPSQTVGPFFHLGMDRPEWADLTRFGAQTILHGVEIQRIHSLLEHLLRPLVQLLSFGAVGFVRQSRPNHPVRDLFPIHGDLELCLQRRELFRVTSRQLAEESVIAAAGLDAPEPIP